MIFHKVPGGRMVYVRWTGVVEDSEFLCPQDENL